MKVKKKFDYNGIPLQIVEREEPFFNATVTLTRVIAPNGGTIPVALMRNETLKSIVAKTIAALDDFAARGANVIETLTNPLKLQP
jgi:hypothetical protein